MTASNVNKVEEEFTEAKNNWELEKLYVDLGSAKGKSLTPVEKKFLRGLLCGFSPAEIANTVYKSRSSSTVRVYLSNGLYKYLEEMLSDQAGYSVKVKNWSRVTHLLEKAGYKKSWGHQELNSYQINQIQLNTVKETDFTAMKSTQTEDWGEAVDVSIFHGRTTELTKMTQWIVQEHCRLVLLLGMGGIGKTALSIKLAEQIKDKFEFVIWRSLHLAPPPETILNQLIEILSPTPQTQEIEGIDSSISTLINCLRSSRCLIILDNFDAVLCNGYTSGSNVALSESSINNSSTYHIPQIQYLQGYEIYGELIRRVGDSQHQSCLLVTSREKPQEISALQGEKLPVRCLKLIGLNQSESREILKAKGLIFSAKEEWKLLNDLYAGNPLFLKLVTTAILELFAGNIDNFLDQNITVFGDIRATFEQQFSRLSRLEKLILFWLTLHQDLGSMGQLQKNIVPWVSPRLILEAIDLLQRRSLIERQATHFSQIPPLRQYVAEKFIEDNFQFMGETSSMLILQTIFETQIKNSLRDMRLDTQI
jgi:hypothetical protein